MKIPEEVSRGEPVIVENDAAAVGRVTCMEMLHMPNWLRNLMLHPEINESTMTHELTN